jgi:hypothetical protein
MRQRRPRDSNHIARIAEHTPRDHVLDDSFLLIRHAGHHLVFPPNEPSISQTQHLILLLDDDDDNDDPLRLEPFSNPTRPISQRIRPDLHPT